MASPGAAPAVSAHGSHALMFTQLQVSYTVHLMALRAERVNSSGACQVCVSYLVQAMDKDTFGKLLCKLSPSLAEVQMGSPVGAVGKVWALRLLPAVAAMPAMHSSTSTTRGAV